MVRLILGRAGSGKTTRLLEGVRARAASGVTGQIFLVPEQFSLNAERALCRACGNAVSLSAEVLTFRSLATRVFTEVGGCAGTPLDKGGRILTMYLAVQNVRDRLRVYGETILRPEFLTKLIALSDELKAYHVTPADLLLLDGSTGTLPDKLHDIACIAGAYDALMTAELNDPADRMNTLAHVLDGRGYFRGRFVCIDGFNGFTGAELDVLAPMFAEAAQVEIALCADSVSDSSGGAGLFSHVQETISAIFKLCSRINVPCEADTASTACRRFVHPDGDLAAVERGLFDYVLPPKAAPSDGSICLYEAESLYSECEAAAATAKELLMRGWRQRDIAVVTRDFAGYGRTAQAVFEKYGLTVFLDAAGDVAQTLPFRFLCTALDIAANGCTLARMMRLLKTGLAGISRPEADILERYASLWNLNGPVWLSEAGFTANPAGYGVPMDDDAQASLQTVNEIRRRAAEPLIRFIDASHDQPARRRAEALYAYAEAVGLAEALDALEDGPSLWDVFCACLDQCVLILGDAPLKDAVFAELFRLLVTQYAVGQIPTGADAISIGDALRSRAEHPRAVFVLGASDGVFPPKPADDGILSQADRRRLADDLGITLAPANESRVAWEQLIAYQTLASPSEYLWLSYAKPNTPSYLLDRIRVILPDLPLTMESSVGPLFRTFAEAPCEELAAAALRPSGADVLSSSAYHVLRGAGAGYDVLSRAAAAASGDRGTLRAPETTQKLYGRDPVLTASRVERFQTCRFAHFAQYGLKLRSDRPASFAAAETGSFLHDVLEKTAKDIAAAGGFSIDRSTLIECIDTSARRHIDEYIETCLGGLASLSPRLRNLIDRLSKTVLEVLYGLVEEFSVSKFIPVGFEVPLEKDGRPISFDAGGETVRLSGKVDRIDMWEVDGKRYIRVVDYKSGSRNFSYADVENGVGIQLLLYLFAVAARDQSMRPAGVLYKPIGNRFVSLTPGMPPEAVADECRKARRCRGIVLDDDEVILAMEAVGEGEKEQFLPVSIEGGVVSRRSRSALVSPRQFAILKGHIARLMRETKAALSGGSITCNPMDRTCTYCDFHRLCRFDPSNGLDEIRKPFSLSSADFFALHEADAPPDDAEPPAPGQEAGQTPIAKENRA